MSPYVITQNQSASFFVTIFHTPNMFIPIWCLRFDIKKNSFTWSGLKLLTPDTTVHFDFVDAAVLGLSSALDCEALSRLDSGWGSDSSGGTGHCSSGSHQTHGNSEHHSSGAGIHVTGSHLPARGIRAVAGQATTGQASRSPDTADHVHWGPIFCVRPCPLQTMSPTSSSPAG